MKFDLLVESYLSLYGESLNQNFSPSNQVFTPKFEKDIKKLNGNPQVKAEIKEFFTKWDQRQLTPNFEMKFQSKDPNLKDSLRMMGMNVNHFPIYAVEVRSRRPSIHLLCTKIGDRVVWLRGFVNYDEYDVQLRRYR